MTGSSLLQLAHQAMRRQLVWRGARSMFVEVRGERVHFFDLVGRSDGPPIVFLHGLGGSAVGFSRCLDAFVRRSRRVVAVDLPGFGFSPAPLCGALGLQQWGEIFDAFVEQEVGEKAVIVGHSLGGAVTARYAALRPERVEASVLVAPAGARVAPERLRELAKDFSVATVEQARALSRRFFHRPPVIFPLVFGPALREVFASPCVARIVEEAPREEGLEPHELRSIRSPLLLLWGKSERVLPYEGIDYFREHLPAHAEIEVVPGFGHCPHLERPKELCRRIDRFLDRALMARAA